jgi:hypothetical protein
MGGRGMAGAAAIFDGIETGRKEGDEILIGSRSRGGAGGVRGQGGALYVCIGGGVFSNRTTKSWRQPLKLYLVFEEVYARFVVR